MSVLPLPRSIARFNRTVTNRVTRPIAGHLPGFGVVIHVGRRSGRQYRTPVNVFTRPGGWSFALTFGEADWVRNVLEAGGGLLESRGRVARFVDPVLVEDASVRDFPPVVRWILRRIDVNQVLVVDEA
jgi:deazaflavin-dependent oxidoreductase (nitroreductase family)